MRRIWFTVCAIIFAIINARADLTIEQKIEGATGESRQGDFTVKIKGDKFRIEATPDISTIIDGKTGDMLTLMHGKKQVVRISGQQAHAAAEMVDKFAGDKEKSEKPVLVNTGRKETINGTPAEIYTCDTSAGKITYWIAPNYPDGAAILQQMKAMQPGAWSVASKAMPDYREFPGIPIKSEMNLGSSRVVTTLVSIKQDPLDDSNFEAPKDYNDMKMPGLELLGKHLKKAPAESSPTP
ncbi:MAG: hypothetical protein QOI04_1719 [Verrucomicrobiota bacterium]|jgi:hypothetical protein